jgi:ABC-type multidrug transport system fused ATPase/permease subunit
VKTNAMRFFLYLLLLLILAGLGFTTYSTYAYRTPLPYTAQTVIIPPRTGTREVVGILHLAGLTPSLPVMVMPLVASGRKVRKRSRLAQDALADASAYASEAVGAMRALQSSCAEGAAQARFEGAEIAFHRRFGRPVHPVRPAGQVQQRGLCLRQAAMQRRQTGRGHVIGIPRHRQIRQGVSIGPVFPYKSAGHRTITSSGS